MGRGGCPRQELPGPRTSKSWAQAPLPISDVQRCLENAPHAKGDESDLSMKVGSQSRIKFFRKGVHRPQLVVAVASGNVTNPYRNMSGLSLDAQAQCCTASPIRATSLPPPAECRCRRPAAARPPACLGRPWSGSAWCRHAIRRAISRSQGQGPSRDGSWSTGFQLVQMAGRAFSARPWGCRCRYR